MRLVQYCVMVDMVDGYGLSATVIESFNTYKEAEDFCINYPYTKCSSALYIRKVFV